ncbi:MAG: hypothetical protein RR444_13520 [Oscillospiraceae bacterium]
MKKFIVILLVSLLLSSCTKKLGCAPDVGSLPDLESAQTSISLDIL